MECGIFVGLLFEVSCFYIDFSVIINVNCDCVELELVEGGIIGYELEISFVFVINDII